MGNSSQQTTAPRASGARPKGPPEPTPLQTIGPSPEGKAAPLSEVRRGAGGSGTVVALSGCRGSPAVDIYVDRRDVGAAALRMRPPPRGPRRSSEWRTRARPARHPLSSRQRPSAAAPFENLPQGPPVRRRDSQRLDHAAFIRAFKGSCRVICSAVRPRKSGASGQLQKSARRPGRALSQTDEEPKPNA